MRRRGNWRRGFRERFARYDPNLKQRLTNRQVLWLHAVSVGEVNLCTQLIRALELRLPNIKFVVSTTRAPAWPNCAAGCRRISAKFTTRLTGGIVGRALAVINPEAIVLVEAEIWPNFLWRARDLKIPVFLANARLSNRSFRGYKRFGFLFRPLFASFAGVRLPERGGRRAVAPDRLPARAVHVVGNLNSTRRSWTNAGCSTCRRCSSSWACRPTRRFWWAEARMTARRPLWRKSRSGCGRVSRTVPGAGAAAF